MNRRTALQFVGALGSAALAGCLSGIQDHFEGDLQGVIPIEIHSESEEYHNLHIEAYARGTDRLTYEEGISVTPGEMVSPQHLSAQDQYLRVRSIDEQEGTELLVEEAAVTADAKYVLVWLYDDDIEIEIERDEDETDADPDGSGSDAQG